MNNINDIPIDEWREFFPLEESKMLVKSITKIYHHITRIPEPPEIDKIEVDKTDSWNDQLVEKIDYKKENKSATVYYADKNTFQIFEIDIVEYL